MGAIVAILALVGFLTLIFISIFFMEYITNIEERDFCEDNGFDGYMDERCFKDAGGFLEISPEIDCDYNEDFSIRCRWIKEVEVE